jgi:CubicO group peptidase (beta-lactamase class C family)
LFSIEEAVRVSTSLPAQILKLTDRGVLREGARADVVVFGPEDIRDKADAFNPHQYSEGISYVFVNGEQATAGTRWLGKLAGEVLRRPVTRADRLSPRAIAGIEQAVRALMTESKAPGVSVAVAVDNHPLYAKGFGLADLELQVPVTPATRFRTASIAKSMTSVVVLSLMEQGKLDLDAEIQQYCSQYPQKEWPVTCRLLLGHLGGVRHYKSDAEARSTQHFFDLESALSTFADDPLLHEPGTKFLYTTFGYNLLGSVAEGASDEPFPGLLKRYVLEPGGMKSTVVDDQAAIIPHRTQGYLRATPALLEELPDGHNLQPGQIYNAPLHDTSMKIPGGGLLSTPSDLVRFALALNTGKLLTDETRERMWTVQKTTEGEETGYGLGWKIREQSGQKIVSHTGGQAGTSTVLVLFPESGTSVAIMCNLQHVKLRDLAVRIAEIAESR